MIEILERSELPEWLKYPKDYLELIKNEKDEFLPWYLMTKKQLLIRYEGLKKRYPSRVLFPFARHDETDDVACWEKNKPGKVIIIHDFTLPGYENKLEFNSFEEWYFCILNA